MKPATNKLLIAALLLCIFLYSCGAGELNTKAETTATAFYTALQKKDYSAALSLCSNKAFTKDTKEEWRDAMETNEALIGDISGFTKTSGFNIATSTSLGTTIALTYNLQCKYGKSSDSLILIKEEDGSMKIFRYVWQQSDAMYVKWSDESEKMTSAYMDAVERNNYDAAIALCSAAALQATPPAKWKQFLDNAKNKLGNISSYEVLKDSTTYHIGANGASGKGNYYDVYVSTTRNNSAVLEKIIFFQKDYDAELKLAGHNFK